MLRILLCLLLMIPEVALSGEVSDAPLPVMQQNPVMMRYYDPRPTTARALARGAEFCLDQYYASVFLADALPRPRHYLADMELYVAEASMRMAAGAGLEAEVTTRLLRPMAGMLDPFLRNYHRALHLPNGGREFRPDNQYAYRYGGAGGWDGRARWEIGNVDMRLKRELLRDRLALMFGLNLSAASRARGWSHGGLDMGFGMVGSWREETWFAHAEGWWLHPAGGDVAGLPNRDYYRVSLALGRGVHWAGTPLKLMIQAQGGASPYHSGVDVLDAAPWLVSLGLRFAQGETQWGFAFTENITQRSTQDFGIAWEVSLPFDW